MMKRWRRITLVLFSTSGESPSSRSKQSSGLTKLVVVLVLLLAGTALFAFAGGPAAGREVQAQVVTPAALENSPYDAETFKIADQLQCPVCQGVTVAYSNSGLAQQMRAIIKKKLEQGEGREIILAYFVERYGESILTNPPRSGFTLLVWLLPVAGFLVSVGVVGLVLRRWGKRLQAARSPVRDSGFSQPQTNLHNQVLGNPPGSFHQAFGVPVSAEVLKEYEEKVEREVSGLKDDLDLPVSYRNEPGKSTRSKVVSGAEKLSEVSTEGE